MSELQPLLLLSALLELELNPFSYANLICRKPLIQLTVLLWGCLGGELGTDHYCCQICRWNSGNGTLLVGIWMVLSCSYNIYNASCLPSAYGMACVNMAFAASKSTSPRGMNGMLLCKPRHMYWYWVLIPLIKHINFWLYKLVLGPNTILYIPYITVIRMAIQHTHLLRGNNAAAILIIMAGAGYSSNLSSTNLQTLQPALSQTRPPLLNYGMRNIGTLVGARNMCISSA